MKSLIVLAILMCLSAAASIVTVANAAGSGVEIAQVEVSNFKQGNSK
ncbi:MAG: hypothetical protein OFPI_08820 [Osedax symbiont Rs2]|nr:MAG: hypothetical protein OFPI_08820 [Osedax symbiont Rs2]